MKALLTLTALVVCSCLIMIVAAFVTEGRREAACTALQLVTFGVGVLVITTGDGLLGSLDPGRRRVEHC
jgi:hypothetical protein